MNPLVVTVREQCTDQRHVLGDAYRDILGREWRFKPFGDEASPDALFARVVYDEATGVTLVCDTSYFIGMEWLVPGVLAVHVEPKMNESEGETEVDYLAMLSEALADSENLKHLAHLQCCRLNSAPIPLKKADTGLFLFLLIQFLTVIKRIRRGGLQRSFYSREQHFHYGMKGRIMLSRSLRQARTSALTDHLCCSVQQFDIDTPANQFLKCALRQALAFLQRPGFHKEALLIEEARLGLRAFATVRDVAHPEPVRLKKVNPVYRDYAEALRLAEMVMSLLTLGHDRVVGQSAIPPYWIDMSQLFELFVFRKLRNAVGSEGRVEYQFAAHYQYLDFLCKAPGLTQPFFIADAKYKPTYERSNNKDDLRQVAGYARLTKVESTLRGADWGWYSASRLIPCLIIYPTLKSGAEQLDLNHGMVRISGWTEFYKIEVSIPVKQ